MYFYARNPIRDLGSYSIVAPARRRGWIIVTIVYIYMRVCARVYNIHVYVWRTFSERCAARACEHRLKYKTITLMSSSSRSRPVAPVRRTTISIGTKQPSFGPTRFFFYFFITVFVYCEIMFVMLFAMPRYITSLYSTATAVHHKPTCITLQIMPCLTVVDRSSKSNGFQEKSPPPLQFSLSKRRRFSNLCVQWQINKPSSRFGRPVTVVHAWTYIHLLTVSGPERRRNVIISIKHAALSRDTRYHGCANPAAPPRVISSWSARRTSCGLCAGIRLIFFFRFPFPDARGRTNATNHRPCPWRAILSIHVVFGHALNAPSSDVFTLDTCTRDVHAV